MHQISKRGIGPLRIGGSFLLGCIVGGFLAVTGTALAVGEDDQNELTQSLLYAIAELAVDSELNAVNIVALRERVDGLEHRLQQLAPTQD